MPANLQVLRTFRPHLRGPDGISSLDAYISYTQDAEIPEYVKSQKCSDISALGLVFLYTGSAGERETKTTHPASRFKGMAIFPYRCWFP